MTKSILKVVVKGMFIGAFLFFMPRFIIGMFIFFGICRLFMGRRSGRFMAHRVAFAERIRSMNPEEFEQFKNSVGTRHCGYAPKTETNI
jgi:hypothetical protein